jgi:hypothetical protein
MCALYRGKGTVGEMVVDTSIPVLVHGEGAEHDLQPHGRLLEEQLEQWWIAPYARCEHVAVNLEVH